MNSHLLGIMASNGIELKEYHFVATLTVPFLIVEGRKMVHSGDVGVDLDRDASLAL